MAKKNYYVVIAGKRPGIYKTWDECKSQVIGFSGAIYKGFERYEEAIAYYKEGNNAIVNTGTGEAVANDIVGEKNTAAAGVISLPDTYAFVDGSFNAATGVYGFGGFLMNGEDKYILQGSGDDPEMASMRNVSGEILGAQAAIEKACQLGIKELTILYDYMGIEMWPTGKWKTNKEGTKAYKAFYDSHKSQLNITFKKVAAHTGIPGNEEADRLAKEAVGIE